MEENEASGLPADFDDVLEDEWKEIRLRRRFLKAIRAYIEGRTGSPVPGAATDSDIASGRGGSSPAPESPDPISYGISHSHHPPRNPVGLALSGGGIRSATFSLGVLQGLRDAGLLPAFDYLSTVSGGGYLGGWWSGWLARDPLFVPADLTDPAGMMLALFPAGDETGLEHREALLDAMSGDDRRELAALAGRVRSRGLEGYEDAGIGDRQRIVEILNALLEQEALYDRSSEPMNPALRDLASPPLRTLVYELIGLHVETDAGRRREERMRALAGPSHRTGDEPGDDRKSSWSRCEQVLLNRLFLEELLSGFLGGMADAGRVIFPPGEGIEPDRYDTFLPPSVPAPPPDGSAKSPESRRPGAGEPPRGGRNDDSSSAWFDPIHHLRLFANYLTPRKGALSGDTWRAIAVLSRNLVLTWLVLLPIFIALMLCGQLYFLWNAATTDDFLPPVRPAVARTVAAFAGGAAASGAAAGGISTAPSSRAGSDAARRRADSTAEKIRHTVSSRPVLLARLAAASQPVIPIFGWIIVVVIAWIISGQDTSSLRGKVMPWVELCVVLLLVSALLWVFGAEITSGLQRGAAEDRSLLDILSWWWSSWPPPLLWGLGAIALLATGLKTGRAAGDYPEGISRKALGQLKREVRRNQLVRLHSTLLVVAVGLSVILLFAGFGHEAVNYLFYTPEPGKAFADYLKEIGGWGGLLLTIGGTIYTLMKASPAGGGDHAKGGESSKTGAFVLGITPPLLVLLLALLSAWWGHGVVARLVPDANSVAEFIHRNRPFHYITFVGIFLGLLFAWYEMAFVGGTWPRLRIFSYQVPKRYIGHLLMLLALLLLGLLVSKGIWSIYTGEFYSPLSADPDRLFWDWYDWLLPHILLGSHPAPRFVSLAIALLAVVTLAVRLRFIRVPRAISGGGNRFVRRGNASGMRDTSSHWTGLEIAGLALVVFLIVAVILLWLVPLAMSLYRGPEPVEWLQEKATRHLTAYILFGFGFCLLFLVVELFFGDGLNYRSFGLLGGIIAALVVLLQFSYIPWDASAALIAEGRTGTVNLWLYRVHAAFGLITTLLTWAIAIGWTVDPNMLSLHSFYKARLTRAYLGASNRRRRHTQRRITEAVVGDDVPLAELRNCRRGAPYHIVNATLNLVGGRDLSTAQRSAANFILTQNYCGSPRTGYRPTSEYMRGGMTLGTAVSISGAAASPNMGSKTPTAALAMLMTLFNVRLGYWAPTPNSEGWHFGQARLWPFYTLREFLSQTHDLSSFCYLTDGGHFDNTGLYALVERGCRYIVVVDCGADPSPCFADLGDAIRRCRIDFGTEFDLDLSPAIPSGEGGRRRTEGHYLLGTITYSTAHLRRLHRIGLGDAAALDRTGYIIVVKPMRGGSETVDVRQYGFENGDFPQQTTADQWFDESQFESYRKLGELSVRQVVAEASESALRRREEADQYEELETDAADVLYRLRRGALPTGQDIRLLFEALHGKVKKG